MNNPCVFPFRYNGVSYSQCTLVEAEDNKPWCSTLVDSNGDHVSGGGHYGDCSPKCPLPGTQTLHKKNLLLRLSFFFCFEVNIYLCNH